MKINQNYISSLSTKYINQKNIFSNIIYNNIHKKSINDIINYRNDLSNEKYILLKRYNHNKNINSYDIKSSFREYKNINEKQKIKRPFHSASLIKKIKINNTRNKSPKLILSNNYHLFNIKQIHEIISLMEKRINLLRNIKNYNDNNYFFYSKYNINYIFNNIRNINSSKNLIFKKNRKKSIFNISTTNYKYKNFSSLSLFKDKYNINNNEDNKNNNINILEQENINKNIKNKSDLIPYTFKRIQNKIRKYYSFSKKIKLYEEKFYNKLINNNNNDKYNDNINNKIYNVNNYNHKYNKLNNINNLKNDNEASKKEDKSVNTEYSIFEKNKNELQSDLKRNKNTNKDSLPFFKNELIASMTYTKDNKFFITTSTHKNIKSKKEINNNKKKKRSIYVYHKNS